MKEYKAYRIVDGKPRWIIVDENGNIKNRVPTKEELNGIEKESSYDRRLKYTDEELLDYLIRFYEENGRIPKTEDFRGPKYPSWITYKFRFGSWNNALNFSGLNIDTFGDITDEELLDYLIRFYEENRRSPTITDFYNNPKYPGKSTYIQHFGSWQNALKLVGLDINAMVKNGVIDTNQQKGRSAELYVLSNHEKDAKDLSGENCKSFSDGLSKNDESYDQFYDVKSSKLHNNRFWSFHLDNCVDFYYLIGYDKVRNTILHKWKISGNFAEGTIVIGNNDYYTYNIENMKQYELEVK